MDRITELDKVLFGTTGNLRINAPNKISLTAKNIINKINNGDFIINNINGKTLILNDNNNGLCIQNEEINIGYFDDNFELNTGTIIKNNMIKNIINKQEINNNNCLTEDEIQEIWDNTFIENI